MMQMMIDAPSQKNSLFEAMNRFIGAVNNMDQTVMVPSLLRDVPVDGDSELSSMKADMDDGDMYGYYQLLKSIRRDIEWGVRRAAAEERSMMSITRMNSSASLASTSSEEEEDDDDEEGGEEEDGDLEKQFQFHLTGLQEVLSKLTSQANSLTKRYKQEVGI